MKKIVPKIEENIHFFKSYVKKIFQKNLLVLYTRDIL